MIIVDDVSNNQQLKILKSLPFKVTPSIFPPTEMAPNSPKIAKDLKHYMIHLPLQSSNANFNSMKNTLMVSATDAQISSRVDEIRALFPSAKYLNNHTGSIFTGDYNAMERLYARLRESGFTFIDSRTSSSTKVEKITSDYGDRYIARDIFLDNKLDKQSILVQIKNAVKQSKKNGHAIAICHPHAVTMKALKSAQPLLKDVELVYIDEYYDK